VNAGDRKAENVLARRCKPGRVCGGVGSPEERGLECDTPFFQETETKIVEGRLKTKRAKTTTEVKTHFGDACDDGGDDRDSVQSRRRRRGTKRRRTKRKRACSRKKRRTRSRRVRFLRFSFFCVLSEGLAGKLEVGWQFWVKAGVGVWESFAWKAWAC
jgi:hypothetical protein